MEEEKTLDPVITPSNKEIINLDLDPKERWIHIVKKYQDVLVEVRDEIIKFKNDNLGFFSSIFESFITTLTQNTYISPPTEFYEELIGISKFTEKLGISYGDLILCNVGCSMVATCNYNILKIKVLQET